MGKTDDLLLRQRDEARDEVLRLRVTNGELWQAVERLSKENRLLKEPGSAYQLGLRNGLRNELSDG